jgi:hypothetical protein
MALAKPVSPVLQRGHTLAQRGIAAAFPFYEGSGNKLYDLSANSNHGTLQNAPPWTGGPFGHCLSLNSTNQAVQIANAPSLNPSFITIAAWCRSTFSGGAQYLVNKNYDGSSVAYSLSLFGSGGVTDGIAFYNGAWNSSGLGGLDLRGDGLWHFVVGTYDGTTLRVYVDGILKSSNAVSGTLPTTNTQPVYIGAYVNDSSYFPGQIDNVLILPYAISAGQIRDLYFDTFVLYRARSRWWEALVSGGGASSVTVLKASLTLTPKLTSGSTSPAVLKGALTLTPKLVTGTVSSSVLKGLLTLTPKLVSVAGSVFTITKAALALTSKLVTGDLSVSAIVHSALTLTPKLVPSAPVSAIIVRGSLVLLPKGVSSPSILAGLSQKQDLTVVPYHYSHMPSDPATQSTYFMREIRRLQSTINDLHKAANQATDEAPLVPLNGMIRYAKGAWASALGGEGLYCYKSGVWTRIV